MHDLPARRSRQPAGFLQAHRRGEGVCGGWAPTPRRAFRQFQYLTPPLAVLPAVAHHAAEDTAHLVLGALSDTAPDTDVVPPAAA